MLPNRRPRFDDSQLTRIPTGDEAAVGASAEIDVMEAEPTRVARPIEGGAIPQAPQGEATKKTPMPMPVAKDDSEELHWEYDGDYHEDVTRFDPVAVDPELSCSDFIEVTDLENELPELPKEGSS